MLIELRHPQGKLHDAHGVVEHDNAAGTQHRTGLEHRIEIHGDIDLIRVRICTEDPPGTTPFSVLPLPCRQNVVDHLLQVVAHGQLVNAGPLQLATHAEETGTAVARRTQAGKPLAAPRMMCGTLASVSALLITVARPTVRPRPERRPDAGHAPLAFERLHQRRFFAYFVSACAGMGEDVEIDARAEDVLPMKPRA